MSVLLVTDDADDDIQNSTLNNQSEYFYKQLKELEYDLLSSVTSFSIVKSSSSIFVKSNKHYRENRRRRRSRLQQCLVKHLLTYMLTLLILTHNIHWSVIFLSLSSIKIMSTHASTTIKRPTTTPSTIRISSKQIGQQCLPINNLQIDQICSKTCRARKTPFEKFDNLNPTYSQTHYLPFCSNILNQNLIKENFFKASTEEKCRENLKEILSQDDDARKASQLFATYMEAIDSASNENRYSIITSDCQKAYRIWTCSIKIPFYHGNQIIPPCRTICDEVERVCPTFRPSDREPLFAGQPLFFCNGGIVKNSDYGNRPHCFDSCHLFHGSLRRPSSCSSRNNSSCSTGSVAEFVEDIVTTPPCFDIEPLTPSSSGQKISSSTYFNNSISNNTNTTSLSASALTIKSSSWSSIILTFNIVFQMIYLQKL